ncbi:hypothetical protein KQX54_018713 [Cotesia glomerata]|uniref:Phage protein n=1 Tax=Cotesia glomerata TaxID=32391 RepID=A0AAV7IR86_COTGL|nr:hypothetical protein KQX54_018713 [Cotesia glomerata]
MELKVRFDSESKALVVREWNHKHNHKPPKLVRINGKLLYTYDSEDTDSLYESESELDLSETPCVVIDIIRKLTGKNVSDKYEEGYIIQKEDLREIIMPLQNYMKENAVLIGEMIKYVSEEVKEIINNKLKEGII